MKLFEKAFILSFWVAGFVFVGRFCQKQTDTFTILGVSARRPYNAEFETRPLTPNEQQALERALNQPYRYFGRGGQAYAFFSEDGKYVVKFFKQRLFRPPHLLNALPLPFFLHRFREKRNWKRSDKLKRDFFSYRVAFDLFQEETGILYSHLNKTNHLNRKLKVEDRLGIVHSMDLDKFDFIVQRRADRVYERIDALLSSGNLQGAKNAVKSLFTLISKRAKLGYRDRDPNIRTNCGFLDDHAIKIDVGRFVVDKSMQTKEGHNAEVLRIIAPFEEWVENTHPELLSTFSEAKDEVLIR